MVEGGWRGVAERKNGWRGEKGGGVRHRGKERPVGKKERSEKEKKRREEQTLKRGAQSKWKTAQRGRSERACAVTLVGRSGEGVG